MEQNERLFKVLLSVSTYNNAVNILNIDSKIVCYMERDSLHEGDTSPRRFNISCRHSKPIFGLFLFSASLGHDEGADALEVVACAVKRCVVRISMSKTVGFSFPQNSYLKIWD